MVNGGGAQHAAALSRQYPELPIGLHFVLTHGRPLGAMPSLVNEHGELGKWLWCRAEAGELQLDEIHEELQRQFARFVTLFGRPPTHIDSHHHVHMQPQIYPLVEAFAGHRVCRCASIAKRRNGAILPCRRPAVPTCLTRDSTVK